jgi:hypothetical protein
MKACEPINLSMAARPGGGPEFFLRARVLRDGAIRPLLAL